MLKPWTAIEQKERRRSSKRTLRTLASSRAVQKRRLRAESVNDLPDDVGLPLGHPQPLCARLDFAAVFARFRRSEYRRHRLERLAAAPTKDGPSGFSPVRSPDARGDRRSG